MRQNIRSRIRLAGLLRNSGRTPIFQDRREGLRISGSGVRFETDLLPNFFVGAAMRRKTRPENGLKASLERPRT